MERIELAILESSFIASLKYAFLCCERCLVASVICVVNPNFNNIFFRFYIDYRLTEIAKRTRIWHRNEIGFRQLLMIRRLLSPSPFRYRYTAVDSALREDVSENQ